MKTPMPDVDAFVEALRRDLPSAEDEARVRARLVTAALVATSAVLTSASASGAAATSGASAGVALVGGAGVGGSAVLGGSVPAAAGGAAGSIGAAAPVALKAGLVAKLLMLPLSAKVGVVAGVALAATSVPLVLEQTRGEHRDASSVSTDARPFPLAARPAEAQAPAAAPDGAEDVPPISEHPLEPGTPAERSPAEPMASPARARSGGAAVQAAPAEARRERGAEAHGRAIAPRRSGVAHAAPSGASASDTPRSTGTRAAHGAPMVTAQTSALGEEARLMERAMLALGQGDAELARRLLAEHARRFPHGLLSPERERAAQRANGLVAGAHDDRTF